MARLIAQAFTPDDAEVALSADTWKTVLQIRNPANHRVAILGYGVYFDGTSATAAPVQVELADQSGAATGTAVTPAKQGPYSETVQTTAVYNATGEPTTSNTIKIVNVHPQSGYEVQFPFGQEYVMAGDDDVGIRCKAGASVNVHAWILFEE